MKSFRSLCVVVVSLVFTLCCVGAVAGEGIETPEQLWAGYDPNNGDFKEDIVAEATKDGIYSRDS